MNIGNVLHLLATLSGFYAFGISIWNHDINLFALATGFYALAILLEDLSA